MAKTPQSMWADAWKGVGWGPAWKDAFEGLTAAQAAWKPAEIGRASCRERV